MKYKIEIMKKQELKEVAEVFMKSFNDVGENWTKKTSLGHIKDNFSGDSHWVAKIGNKIVGILLAVKTTMENGEELFIDSIAVLPDHRKQNIGRMLWEKALEYAKKNGFVGIRLLANPDWDSYKWYKRRGHKESGWVDMYKEVK